MSDKNSHKVLWICVSIFICLAIGGMWAVDYFYSPEMNNEHVLTDAVGK